MSTEAIPAQGPVDVVVGRHTPGPWEVVAGDDYRIEAAAIPAEYPHLFPGDDLGRLVAMVGNRQPDFGAADAALISAAPDLLAALQKVVAISDRKHDAWDEAKASIAKALGLTPNAKLTGDPQLHRGASSEQSERG